jgi:hypothetical protein
MKTTFTIRIEKCPDEEGTPDKWNAICEELGLVVEEDTAESARKTALELIPEMYSYYVRNQSLKHVQRAKSKRPISLRIIDVISVPTHHFQEMAV